MPVLAVHAIPVGHVSLGVSVHAIHVPGFAQGPDIPCSFLTPSQQTGMPPVQLAGALGVVKSH